MNKEETIPGIPGFSGVLEYSHKGRLIVNGLEFTLKSFRESNPVLKQMRCHRSSNALFKDILIYLQLDLQRIKIYARSSSYYLCRAGSFFLQDCSFFNSNTSPRSRLYPHCRHRSYQPLISFSRKTSPSHLGQLLSLHILTSPPFAPFVALT